VVVHPDASKNNEPGRTSAYSNLCILFLKSASLAMEPGTGFQQKDDKIEFFIDVDTMAWVDCIYPIPWDIYNPLGCIRNAI
jgi:hypothetical protein